jgi:hypothetical protein
MNEKNNEENNEKNNEKNNKIKIDFENVLS